MPTPQRFIFACDLHFGYERKGGHKVPLHDQRALDAVLAFAADFKPDTFIWGGDALDCGAISHHNAKKPGATEGMKLAQDAADGRKAFIEPVEKLMRKGGNLVYIVGNHEDWITDFTDKYPALEGLLNIETLLKLNKWKVIPQGEEFKLGKLLFVHGDTVSGGEHVAKAAVTNYETNIRFGHHHCFQAFTKTSPISQKLSKTGIAVPCMCGKDPRYGEGKPNRWAQGFLWGYITEGGYFSDYVSIITDGKFIANGKEYKG